MMPAVNELPIHCRIGSSEKAAALAMASHVIHCRIGSSEKREVDMA